MHFKRKNLYIIIALVIAIVLPLIYFFTIYKYTSIPKISISEALESLPYLTWVSDADNIDKIGVTKYEKGKAYDGINIYTSLRLPTAHLIDMYGNVLHTWSLGINGLNYIKILKNGDLLGYIKDKMLVEMDWNSKIKWKTKMRFHHEIEIPESEDVYSLIRRDEMVVKYGLPMPVLKDYIVILSSDGKVKREISLYEVLKNEIPVQKFINIYRWINEGGNFNKILERYQKNGYMFAQGNPIDIFHTNTVKVIDRSIEGLCNKGDLLVSIRELDLIGIIDIKTEKLKWKWGPGIIDRQHYPVLLENGNILIFDNGYNRGYSRVVELNPVAPGGEIVWEYKANPPEQFFSKRSGTNQRLPNGNTLISEGSRGRVFEITEDGEIVWEFYNPQINKDKKERATIYRFNRITDPENYPCLKQLQKSI